jgi:hypothetical protein
MGSAGCQTAHRPTVARNSRQLAEIWHAVPYTFDPHDGAAIPRGCLIGNIELMPHRV